MTESPTTEPVRDPAARFALNVGLAPNVPRGLATIQLLSSPSGR